MQSFFHDPKFNIINEGIGLPVFSINSEANASELIENIEDMCLSVAVVF